MAKKSPEKRIFTVPNILSMFRILLIPVYAWLYFNSKIYIAAGVMALSMLTDAFDGLIARRFNLITNFGKILDPVADKLTQAVVLGYLAVRFWEHKQFLLLVCIFFVKEFVMFLMGVAILRKGKILSGALIPGKICTALLFLGMMLFIILPDMKSVYIWLITLICSAAMLISLFFYVSTYLGADYGVKIVPISEQTGAANDSKSL